MKKNHTPHKFLNKVLVGILRKSESPFLSGDFEELYKNHSEAKGRVFASLWLWYQVMISLPPIIKFSLRRSFSMLKNYWKISIRNMLRSKVYTFINVSGFAIGIASFLLIAMHVIDELSYDTFHSKSDRIHRIVLERTYPDRIKNWITTSPMLHSAVARDFPEVETSTALRFIRSEVPIEAAGKKSVESKIAYADSNFFNVFDLSLVSGDPAQALLKPYSVIISRETATKYFGDNNPVGESIKFLTGNASNVSFLVTGIFEKIPANSHFHFDILLSESTNPIPEGLNWFVRWAYYTYIVLKENVDAAAFESKLQEITMSYFKPEVERRFGVNYDDYLASGNGYKFFLQPLTDIHLGSHYDNEIEANGNRTYVYIMAGVAFLILLIACINFTNLTTARSSNRLREIGVRKALGSARTQLIKQFLFESITLSFISLIIGLAVVQFLLPYFENFTNKDLGLHYFDNLYVLPGLILFSVFIGTLSGSYPAFFLSSFRPAKILKGGSNASFKGGTLRNILVVFQFSSSLLLIAGTFIIHSQISFLINKDIGFDKESVLVIENAGNLGNQSVTFREQLSSYSGVVSVGSSLLYPAYASVGGIQRIRDDAMGNAVSMFYNRIGYDFVDALKMEVVEGRNFSREIAGDSVAILINETAVKTLGMSNPLEQAITNNGTFFLNIIGVVKDFNFQSLHSEIQPIYLRLNRNPDPSFIAVRLSPGNLNNHIAYIESQWNAFTNNTSPFMFSLLDDNLAKYYVAEDRTQKISGVFSTLAIVIGCLGLFGLATFTAEQKTKDVGIRKALGATSNSIVFLLSKEFIKLIGVSIVLSVPLSYLLMQKWLDSFAYSISIPYEVYIFAGAITMFIALATISFQIVRAANKNPVDALKYE